MAKFAVIFLFFALFAVAMAASVPKQEPNPIADGFQKVLDDAAKFLNENFNEAKFAEFQKTVQETGKQVLEAVKKGSQTVNDNIQKAQA
ncbi:uncharacterized protein Dana_GF24420 [Drosophila ananassae]|uniref:Neuropeptide-like 2 n=1 Tax=Drosophila ananassae TaxID=7217 RepID=B3M5E0_DROAN|nr:neuropeptide-like 2 [Drosophila ananassae]EDV39550.1 uncharacterized protein Dana_GF24420 [Drosophila ananassae]